MITYTNCTPFSSITIIKQFSCDDEYLDLEERCHVELLFFVVVGVKFLSLKSLNTVSVHSESKVMPKCRVYSHFFTILSLNVMEISC